MVSPGGKNPEAVAAPRPAANPVCRADPERIDSAGAAPTLGPQGIPGLQTLTNAGTSLRTSGTTKSHTP